MALQELDTTQQLNNSSADRDLNVSNDKNLVDVRKKNTSIL